MTFNPLLGEELSRANAPEMHVRGIVQLPIELFNWIEIFLVTLFVLSQCLYCC